MIIGASDIVNCDFFLCVSRVWERGNSWKLERIYSWKDWGQKMGRLRRKFVRVLDLFRNGR